MMTRYYWDTTKPYHKQEIYLAARVFIKGHDILIGWTATGEHKEIRNGDLTGLKRHISFMASIDQYADTLKIL